MAEATIQLTCTIEAGPQFRIVAEITQATDMSQAVFVHQSGAVEIQDTYLRVATINDMSSIGEERGAKGTLYRKASAQVDSLAIATAASSKAVFKNRVSQLVKDLTDAEQEFTGVFTFDLPLEGE
jgi:hypothetical protein